MLKAIADADIPHIAALMNRAYRGATGWSTEQGYISGDRTSEALLRAELAAKPAGTFLKWQDGDGSLLGCVWLEPLGGGRWYLGSLTTEPAVQNGGLGKALLAAGEEWARARGAARMRITVVNVRDTLIAWYRRRGYCLTGETAPFPYDDDRFGVPLRPDLRFVFLEKDLEGADGLAVNPRSSSTVPV